MTEQRVPTTDERWAVATLHRSMAGIEPDLDVLLAGALARGPRQQQRRRRTWALVAAALVLVVGLGTMTVAARDAGTRLAEPAAPPIASALPSTPEHLAGRTAALYLARQIDRTPTDYRGAVDDEGVSAYLSFDGHRSTLTVDPRSSVEPTTIEAWDVSVRLEPASRARLAEMHQDGIFTCSGRWLDDCVTSVPAEGTAVTTGSAVTAYGCCAIRGARVNVVAYQRRDRVVVWAEGRSDMFSLEQLTTIAMSPAWDLRATPSAEDVEAAAALEPFGS